MNEVPHKPEPPTAPAVSKARTKGNLIQALLGLPIALMLFIYSPFLLGLLTRQPPPSYPVSILQPASVAVVYVLFFSVVGHLMAKWNERMFKDNAFGTWSRYGILYLFFFSALVFLAALMMGAFPS